MAFSGLGAAKRRWRESLAMGESVERLVARGNSARMGMRWVIAVTSEHGRDAGVDEATTLGGRDAGSFVRSANINGELEGDMFRRVGR